MKLSKKEREKLENELRELTTPNPELCDVEMAEELTELIDDDILTKIFELGEKQNKEDE